jgi:outer membrane protein OmpA-like peptidoglycan-associated protein
VQYQPGQAPKNLALSLADTVAAAPSSAPSFAHASSAINLATATLPVAAPAVTAPQTCDEHAQKWEKTCGDAGYPATYVGRILGETRTGCADGALHDVWVSNSCAPPEPTTAQTARTDAICGTASNDEFDNAPTSELCAAGVASAVNGDGPWTWACSGINGGDAAACGAQKRVPPRNGICGSANGVAVAAAPEGEFCATGKATIVTGRGPWVWTCNGVGKGSSVSCIAPVATPAPIVSAPVVASESESAASAAVVPPAASSTSSAASSSAAVSHAVDATAKGEFCGVAAETLAYEAPEKDLCRVGTPSVVNGSGPWSWSCTDNEGVSSSCQTMSLGGGGTPASASESSAAAMEPAAPLPAPQVSVLSAPAASATPTIQPAPAQGFVKLATPTVATIRFACGFSADLPARRAPAVGLCKTGKASAVRGSGPWGWSCGTGADQVSCAAPKIVNASCGVANGAALDVAPVAMTLCAEGEATSLRGAGPWQWSCKGVGGGGSVSCAATVKGVAAKVDGTCGAAHNTNLRDAPASGLCATGVASALSGDGPWHWSCSGLNEGAVASCFANKIAAPQMPGRMMNGLCGSANGAIAPMRPSDGLCVSGEATAVVGNGPWNWDCIGENGGMTVSCTAPLQPPSPLNGACGSASGVPTSVYPQNGLCSAGIIGAVNGHGPWTWTCSGVNGGAPASCIAPVAGKTGALPSVMTAAAGVPAAASHSGLTTPQLSKSFASAPMAAPVPPVVSVAETPAPISVPGIPEGATPLQPPALQSALQTSKALQASADSDGIHIPGNRLTLDASVSTLPFDHGSGNLGDASTERLDKLVIVLQANPDVRISLFAYADNADSTPRDARHLSLTRALAVRDYLESKDIAQSRVDVHAEGANTSQAPLDRVEIRVND